MPHHASRQPATPPASDSRRLSVEQVPHELAPRGAHGQPHRDLFRARGAAHQQQRREVAARDREDEADDRRGRPRRAP